LDSIQKNPPKRRVFLFSTNHLPTAVVTDNLPPTAIPAQAGIQNAFFLSIKCHRSIPLSGRLESEGVDGG